MSISDTVYTHYWIRKPSYKANDMKYVAKDVDKILSKLIKKGYRIGGSEEGEMFLANEKKIIFNGDGEYDRHGDFRFRAKQKTPCMYESCTTDDLSYDIGVMCTLIVLKHRLNIKVKSDGKIDDYGWVQAKKYCQDILNYGDDFKLDGRPNNWNKRFKNSGSHIYWQDLDLEKAAKEISSYKTMIKKMDLPNVDKALIADAILKLGEAKISVHQVRKAHETAIKNAKTGNYIN